MIFFNQGMLLQGSNHFIIYFRLFALFFKHLCEDDEGNNAPLQGQKEK